MDTSCPDHRNLLASPPRRSGVLAMGIAERLESLHCCAGSKLVSAAEGIRSAVEDFVRLYDPKSIIAFSGPKTLRRPE